MKKTQILLSIFALLSFTFSYIAAADENGDWFNSGDSVWKSGFGTCWDSVFPGRQSPDCGGAMPMAEPEMSGHFWADDQDYDGVLDNADKCPFTPQGVSVDADGCAIDSDGDGVPDYLDKCPDTPLGSVVDTDGCPLSLVTLRGIHFAFDSAQLTGEAKSILDRAIPSINANSASIISVEGHTDSTGSDAYNSQLSMRRARSVADYLSAHGVSSGRLSVSGMGESSPVADNSTSAGRALNRRVEVNAK